MPFQVRMFWDGFDPHPAFAEYRGALAYAKGLLAALPDDAHPETEVLIFDPAGEVVFRLPLIAWRFAVLAAGDRAYTESPAKSSD